MNGKRRSRRLRLIGGVALVVVALGLTVLATIELIKSFDFYVGWEVGFARTVSAIISALAIAAGFFDVRMIRRTRT